MKKILSLVLAMLMIFSMVPAVFAAETSESDYQAAIEYLKAIELYKGTTDGDAADELVERYQMALFTARMVTGRVDKAYWETDANDSGFTDIDELNAEALGGVCYAAQQGIVNGIGGSEFAPFDNVTYRDAIVMVVRALGFNYPASGYPWSYINKARELGVLDGITGVSYTAEVKREVIAQLLYNAINAEIKGESIAATVFGVEETIVMVTASYDLVYGADASKALKNTMVKVSAIDAEGEPIGTEYYVPYSTLGAKNPEQANALVGTYFKLTHKGNFAQFLAVESLSKVFENTPSKKEVSYTYTSGALTLGGVQYVAMNGDYTKALNNAQDILNGAKEVKVFKAFGATQASASTEYILAADGNIYSKSNPFVPYAIYSALVDKWFRVETNITSTPNTNNWVTELNKSYTMLTADEVAALLAKTTEQVMGHSRLATGSDYHYYSAKYPYSGNPTDYDYYKAIASDIDGDGDYDRIIARPYELLRINKWNENETVDGSTTAVAKFKALSYTYAQNQADFGADKVLYGDKTYTAVDYKGRAGEGVDLYRFTGIKLDKVPNGAFVVAYISRDGIGAEKEIDIVEVIGGEQKNADDNAYVFQTYIRGYDSITNKVIYGANYDTMYIGTWAVKNTTLYDAPGAPSSMKATYTAATAKYVQQFWNKYVNVYVLNGAIIHIEEISDSDNYVILESFTDFTEDGLKAIAVSTLDGGRAEITVGALNGWSLGGYDYELFLLLKQMTDLGLTVKDYPLPVALNTIYAVRSVDENGAYNLVEAGAPEHTNKNLYVNNFGYIIGTDGDNTFGNTLRVATSDKDLWIIKQGDKVHVFKGKLAAVELTGLDFYKATDNQYVAVAPAGLPLGPILGNTTEGLDYWIYNETINNYKNETYFNGFYYGQYMTNVRTGAAEFVVLDTQVASDLFKLQNNLSIFNQKNYILLEDGAIYAAVNKVMPKTEATYRYAVDNKTITAIEIETYDMSDAATLEFATGKYFGKYYVTYEVSANLDGDEETDTPTELNSMKALLDVIAGDIYTNVYDRDFDLGNLDAYTTDLFYNILSNVTFVHHADNGLRYEWKAAYFKNNAWNLTDASAYGFDANWKKSAFAHVMYDYANIGATVYLDTFNGTVIADEVALNVTMDATCEAKAVVPTVDVARTGYDKEDDITYVVINVDKKIKTPTFVLDNSAAAANVSVSGKVVSFTVAGKYEGAVAVSALLGLDVELLEKVDLDAELTTYVRVKNGGKDNSRLFDGQYVVSTNYEDSRWAGQHIGYADGAVSATLTEVLKDDAAYATAPYNGALIFTNEDTFTATAMRIAIPFIGTSFMHKNLTILTKGAADDAEWKVAATIGDIVTPTSQYDLVDTGNGKYFVYDFEITNGTDVKYFAIASTRFDADGNKIYSSAQSSGTYWNLSELEFYK